MGELGDLVVVGGGGEEGDDVGVVGWETVTEMAGFFGGEEAA